MLTHRWCCHTSGGRQERCPGCWRPHRVCRCCVTSSATTHNDRRRPACAGLWVGCGKPSYNAGCKRQRWCRSSSSPSSRAACTGTAVVRPGTLFLFYLWSILCCRFLTAVGLGGDACVRAGKCCFAVACLWSIVFLQGCSTLSISLHQWCTLLSGMLCGYSQASSSFCMTSSSDAWGVEPLGFEA